MQSQLYIAHGDSYPASLDKNELLVEALENIVKEYPPQESYTPPLKGLWSGPTGIAYLFFQVSTARPDLTIASKNALHWAEAYLAGKRETESMALERAGISSELLVYQALRAAISKDIAHVEAFLQNIPAILEGKFETEWHSGRAGSLYLIRLIRQWVPEAAPLLEESAAQLRKIIMAEGPDWSFRGTRYIGAAHGDIGILTQLALTSPTDSEKKQLQEWLLRLLNWQKENGNWPVNEKNDPKPYVQFCHGAPGVIQGLISMRPIFPDLAKRIDHAISVGNELIWKEGALTKEPNLCHGIFGNAFTLPAAQRDFFLSLATPKSVAEARAADPAQFEKANYGVEYSLLAGYWPGAAWTWLVSEKQDAGIIAYNDL